MSGQLQPVLANLLISRPVDPHSIMRPGVGCALALHDCYITNAITWKVKVSWQCEYES